MSTPSLSIPNSVAFHFYEDSKDFLQRFDILWEELLQKSGRIKSFVDLMMTYECALKSQIFLSNKERDPTETYKAIRRAGHNIRKLSRILEINHNEYRHKQKAELLEPFEIMVRYSLDAHATFFPETTSWSSSAINYSSTIGNDAWVKNIREHIKNSIDSLSKNFCGEIENDISKILAHKQEMQEFIKSIIPAQKNQ